MTLSSTARQIVFWALIILGALLIYKLVNPGSKNTQPIDLTQLEEKINKGELKQLTVRATETVAVDRVSGVEYHIQLSNEHTKAEILSEARGSVNGKPRVDKVEDEPSSSYWLPALYYLLAVRAAAWFLDFHVAADAVGRQQSSLVREIAREAPQ